jgi:hypothetical protein
MSIEDIVYIISISFQLSGAILLIIKYGFVSIPKAIAEKEKKEHRVVGEQAILAPTQPSTSEIKENIWLNRFAFWLIAIGYLISVFGSINESSRCLAFWLIILLSAILTVPLFLLSKKLSNRGDN